MKMKYTLIFAYAAGMAALPAVSTAQSSGEPGRQDREQGLQGASGIEASRVDQATLERDLTAQDIIGREVIASDGETIGEIVDIGFGRDFPLAWQIDRAGGSGPGAGEEPEAATSDEFGRETTRGIGESANAEPVIYISVGGVLGVGEDTIRVPASALQWDPVEETFRIGVNRDQFVAIADRAARSLGQTE